MKKLLLLLFSAVLVLAGCGNSSTESSDLPESRNANIDPTQPMWEENAAYAAENNVTLDWFIELDWYDYTWGETIASRQMTLDTGVTVNVTVGNEDTLNQMLASGSLPDVVTIDNWSPNNATASEWAYSMTDLSAAYSPYFLTDAVNETAAAWMTQEDGEIYGYPNYTFSPEDVENGDAPAATAMVCREDLYTAAGEPSFSTPEELVNGIAAIGEAGDASANPPTADFGWTTYTPGDMGTIGEFFQDYLAIPYVDENGNPVQRYMDPEYLAYIDAFNAMYMQGSFPAEIFTWDQSQVDENIKNSEYGCFLSSNATQDWQHFEDDYVIVEEVPANSNGDDPYLRTVKLSGWQNTYVTKNADDPESAFLFLEYLLCPEGTLATQWGSATGTVEGEEPTYYMDDNNMPQYTEYGQSLIDNGETSMPWYPMIQDVNAQALGLGFDTWQPVADWSAQYTHMTDWRIENTAPDTGTPEAKNYETFTLQIPTIFANAVMGGGSEQFIADYNELYETYDGDAIIEARAVKIQANVDKMAASGITYDGL